MAIRGGSALLLGAALALAAPAGAGADWPVYGHDLANSRSAGAEGPTPGAVASMQRAWTYTSGNGDFTGTPAVAGGVVVAGTSLGTIYAVDAVTGKLRWSRDVGHQVNGSAAIDLNAPGGPAVFVPIAQIGTPRLLALNLSNGAVRWDTVLTRQDGADVYGSPVFWRGSVYMGTSGPNNDEAHSRGSVVALEESNGGIRWQTFTVPPGDDGGGVWSTPAIDTGTGRLFVGTGNAYHAPAADTTDAVLELRASDGAIVAHFQTTPNDVWELNAPTSGPDYDFGASPNLIRGADGRQLVGEGSKSGTYWALDPGTMKPAWSTSVGPGSGVGGILGSTAYDGTRIYGNDTIDSDVWALGRDGMKQWDSPDGGTLNFDATSVANGVAYIDGPAGFLTARDAGTGSVLAKFPLDGPTLGGVSIVGRAVYTATGTGPPPQPESSGPDTSQMSGSGSIIAFGDTSQSGATALSTAPSQTAAPTRRTTRRHRRRIRLSVRPRRVPDRRLVTFRFRARRGSRPVRGATIRFAGHRVRTGRRGRATLRIRLPRDGRYVARATRHGLAPGRVKVVAL